jgi:hypothetical protein
MIGNTTVPSEGWTENYINPVRAKLSRAIRDYLFAISSNFKSPPTIAAGGVAQNQTWSSCEVAHFDRLVLARHIRPIRRAVEEAT